jgi:hypothetical protein
MQNYLKSTLKTKGTLFLNTAKWLFIVSEPSQLAHAKKKGKHQKKKHYKSACFYAPQNGFSFLDQTNWHMHKSLKNDRKIANNSPQKQQNIPTF